MRDSRLPQTSCGKGSVMEGWEREQGDGKEPATVVHVKTRQGGQDWDGAVEAGGNGWILHIPFIFKNFFILLIYFKID